MELKVQRWCVYSAYVCVIIFLTGFVVAGFIPPPGPNKSAGAIAAQFRGDHSRIIIGMVIAMLGAAFTAPFIAAITAQMRHIQGRLGVLPMLQLSMGTCLVLEFELCLMIWQVAAFRSGRSPEEIQLLNDLGWIPFIGWTGTTIIQLSSIAAAILLDRRPTPLYPRWLAYFNVFVFVCFLPGTWTALVQTGPISWNGIIAFWLGMLMFVSWYLVNATMMLKAIKLQERDAQQTTAEGGFAVAAT